MASDLVSSRWTNLGKWTSVAGNKAGGGVYAGYFLSGDLRYNKEFICFCMQAPEWEKWRPEIFEAKVPPHLLRQEIMEEEGQSESA